MLIEGVKAGKMTPKQMAGMLKQMPKPPAAGGADPKQKALVTFSDKQLGGKGFVAWTPFRHPTLGHVENGGVVPYADTTPPPASSSSPGRSACRCASTATTRMSNWSRRSRRSTQPIPI